MLSLRLLSWKSRSCCSFSFFLFSFNCVKSEEAKAEMKRAKEALEAKKNETSEGKQNAIEMANRIATQLREKKKDEKDEKHRLLLQSREERKRAKEKAKELKEEKKVALALAALEVPTSKGVRRNRRESRWKVQLSAHGKN